MLTCVIWNDDLVKINFAEFTLGGLREKHAAVTWNMRMT